MTQSRKRSSKVSDTLLTKTALGGRLRLVREEAGLTLAEFGKRIGCDGSYISQLENGKGPVPSDTFLLAIQAVFGVCRDWVRTGQGERFTQFVTESHDMDAPALAEELRFTLLPIKQKIAELMLYMEALDRRVEDLSQARGTKLGWSIQRPRVKSVKTGPAIGPQKPGSDVAAPLQTGSGPASAPQTGGKD